MTFEIAPKETEVKLNWEQAMFYCQFLDYNGGGWRLPNKDELNWMYENKTDDMQYEDSIYWSSTEYVRFYVWAQYFSTGGPNNGRKTFTYYVRAIRNKS